MNLLAQLLRELAALVESPGLIRAQLTLMEDKIMTEIQELRQSFASEIQRALDSLPDAETLRLAVERADNAEAARANIEGAFSDYRNQITALKGEVDAEGLFGQTTTTTTEAETTTTTEAPVDTETTTEVTTEAPAPGDTAPQPQSPDDVAPGDRPVVQPTPTAEGGADTSETSTPHSQGEDTGTGFEPVQ